MNMLGVSRTAFSEVISLDSNKRTNEKKKERKKERKRERKKERTKETTWKREQHHGKTAKQVSTKLKAVLPRNLDYSKLKSISNTIYWFDVKIHQDIHICHVLMFNFTPITMTWVDKTLSTCMMVLPWGGGIQVWQEIRKWFWRLTVQPIMGWCTQLKKMTNNDGSPALTIWLTLFLLD